MTSKPRPGEIAAYPVTEARTFQHNDGRTVVLKISTFNGTEHYVFDKDDFAVFAKQMHSDARLLTGKAPPGYVPN